jgi:hypothetical protein
MYYAGEKQARLLLDLCVDSIHTKSSTTPEQESWVCMSDQDLKRQVEIRSNVHVPNRGQQTKLMLDLCVPSCTLSCTKPGQEARLVLDLCVDSIHTQFYTKPGQEAKLMLDLCDRLPEH